MGLESYFSAPFLMSFITAANVYWRSALHRIDVDEDHYPAAHCGHRERLVFSVLGEFRALLPADLPLFPPASAQHVPPLSDAGADQEGPCGGEQ